MGRDGHPPLRHYTSDDEDSARWAHVELRPDDVVISTRSKHGTTWTQAILLMLVHGPDLPAPLAELSPWVDHLVTPIAEIAAAYEAQQHRRILKTHTPLDGVPLPAGVHAVVVARDPLDAALSLAHQVTNIDRQVMAARTGTAGGGPTRTPREWLHDWVHATRDPVEALDSLEGVLWHLSDAWRRREDPAVTLVHYADLSTDLAGQVDRLAGALGIEVDAAQVQAVAEATDFDAMRARPDDFVPDNSGVLADHAAFFRAGTSGGATALLSDDDLATYRDRMDALAPPDLRAWLCR